MAEVLNVLFRIHPRLIINKRVTLRQFFIATSIRKSLSWYQLLDCSGSILRFLIIIAFIFFFFLLFLGCHFLSKSIRFISFKVLCSFQLNGLHKSKHYQVFNLLLQKFDVNVLLPELSALLMNLHKCLMVYKLTQKLLNKHSTQRLFK